MGSVKDLKVVREPTSTMAGEGIFIFSDRYSVFDWGEMPDLIPDKGKSIAILGAYFFELAERRGFKTHYLGIGDGKDFVCLDRLERPQNSMRVKIFNVVRPLLGGDKGYDYSVYENVQKNFLIPLEVIYRNRLPEGSSVFNRLAKNEITPSDLGLDDVPVPNQILKEPVVDVSTKLERIDRYVKWDDARKISGLNVKQIERLKEILNSLNDMITQEFSKIGLINEDGKIEFAVDENGEICIVDVFGTLDECRFTYDGVAVSKEVARMYYRKSEWFAALNRAKEKDKQNFKEICERSPERLPVEFKEAVANLYRYVTNKITGREWFSQVPELKDSISLIKRFI